jgi:hypothetical protein
MAALARTPALPEATLVGPLSAQLSKAAVCYVRNTSTPAVGVVDFLCRNPLHTIRAIFGLSRQTPSVRLTRSAFRQPNQRRRYAMLLWPGTSVDAVNRMQPGAGKLCANSPTKPDGVNNSDHVKSLQPRASTRRRWPSESLR